MGNVIDLTKKSRVVLEKLEIFGEKFNVVAVMDISGSMQTEFRKGAVQETLEKILGVGINMDSNKSIEVYAFNRDSNYIGEANEGNIYSFVENIFLKKVRIGGGTCYTPVMQDVAKQVLVEPKKSFFSMFSKNKVDLDKNLPTLVFFITDGDNADPAAAESFIKSVSDKPIFWQFVGIGNESFSFLKKLDNLPGRVIDNANFMPIADITKEDTDTLYQKILKEVPVWLKEARKAGIVK